MIIKLWFACQQAYLMAIEDFIKAKEGDKDLEKKLRFKKKNNQFYLTIDSSVKEEFLEFVQKTRFYKKHFRIQVVYDKVRGFVSDEAAVEAMDLFNENRFDFYIDCSEPLVEVKTNKGKIHTPCISDPTLEEAFWNFVDSRDEISRNVIVGIELC